VSTVALLSEIIAQGGKISARFYRDNPTLATLLRHGYLSEAGVLKSVVCNDCEAPHAAPVLFEDGRYGYVCSDIGFVVQDRAVFQALQPDLPLLIERLPQALDCKKTKGSPLHDQTWRIGAVVQDAGEVMLYFQPRLQGEEDASNLTRALSQEVRSRWRLIVTSLGTLPVANAETVRLSDLAEIDSNTGAFHILAQPGDLVGMPRKNKRGRPSEYGAILSALIAARKKSGASLAGRNAEAKALLGDFKQEHPDLTPPSISTVRGYVSNSRGGQ